ncbi:hypothetical protein BH20ACI1_BH20ACI1_06370 [soil metagenome]
MIAEIEEKLIEKIHALPKEKQAKVLEFVEEIEVSTNGQKTDEEKEKERHKRLMSLVGIGRSKSGNVSERVDEILAEGINKREGWSLP